MASVWKHLRLPIVPIFVDCRLNAMLHHVLQMTVQITTLVDPVPCGIVSKNSSSYRPESVDVLLWNGPCLDVESWNDQPMLSRWPEVFCTWLTNTTATPHGPYKFAIHSLSNLRVQIFKPNITDCVKTLTGTACKTMGNVPRFAFRVVRCGTLNGHQNLTKKTANMFMPTTK